MPRPYKLTVGARHASPSSISFFPFQPKGDCAQASRGHCIGPGGLRCSLKHNIHPLTA